MEEQGTVSLWLGNVDSEDLLENALQIIYSEDGDFDGSDFTRGFQIDFYDENFKESEFYEENSNDLSFLLAGFSYDETIIQRFSSITISLKQKYNTVMLLYNFRYVGEIQEWQGENISFDFIGIVSYEL
jgi:Immunity protein 22